MLAFSGVYIVHTHTTRVGAFILVFNSPQGASGNTAFL